LLGNVPIFENAAHITVGNLEAGNNVITAFWAGGDNNGTIYEGVSTSINFATKYGTTSSATMSLTADKPYGISQEGTVTLTATFSQALPGRVNFYQDDEFILYADIVGTTATITTNNSFAAGTGTFSAVWDGNQSSHPRYYEKTATLSWEVKERETIPSMTLAITPNPTGFRVNTTFIATLNTSTAINGSIAFVVDGQSIGSANIVDNVASLSSTSLLPGTFECYAYYQGSLIEPKYYPVTSNYVTLPIATGAIIPADIVLQVRNDGYRGYTTKVKGFPIHFIGDITTSTQLTGDLTIVGNRLALTATNWTYNHADVYYSFPESGTYETYGLWYGAMIDDTLYADKRSAINTLTVVDAYTLDKDIVLSVKNDGYQGTGAPYVKGETQTLTASFNTSGSFTGLITFVNNGTTTSTVTIVASTASTNIVFNSSGTYTLRGDWSNGYADDSRPFYDKVGKVTTITVVDAYTLAPAITLAPTKTMTSGLPAYLSASVTTSSQMANNINFYSNGTFIGTATFSSSTNKAILITNSSTFNSTGTYTISAQWLGGNIDDGRPYFGKTATTSTVNVVYAVPFPGTLTLSTTPSTVNPFATESIRVTASSGTTMTGVITLTDEIIDNKQYKFITTSTATNMVMNGIWDQLPYSEGFIWYTTSTPFTISTAPTVKIYSPDLDRTSYYYVADITKHWPTTYQELYPGLVNGQWLDRNRWTKIELRPVKGPENTVTDIINEIRIIFGATHGAPFSYPTYGEAFGPWVEALQRCVISIGYLSSNSNYNKVLSTSTVTTLTLTTGSTATTGLAAAIIPNLSLGTTHKITARTGEDIFDGVRVYGTQSNTATLTLTTASILVQATPPYYFVYGQEYIDSDGYYTSSDPYLKGTYLSDFISLSTTSTSFRAVLTPAPTTPVTISLANFGTVISTATTVGSTATFNFPANHFSTGTYCFTAIYNGATTYISGPSAYRIA